MSCIFDLALSLAFCFRRPIFAISLWAAAPLGDQVLQNRWLVIRPGWLASPQAQLASPHAQLATPQGQLVGWSSGLADTVADWLPVLSQWLNSPQTHVPGWKTPPFCRILSPATKKKTKTQQIGKFKQGKETADHLRLMGDWFYSLPSLTDKLSKPFSVSEWWPLSFRLLLVVLYCQNFAYCVLAPSVSHHSHGGKPQPQPYPP